MTFISNEQLSSPNCVRAFAQQQQRTSNSVSMDEIKHRLVAMSVIDAEDPNNKNNNITNPREMSLPMSVFMVRNRIFQLLVHMGSLSSHFMTVNQMSENPVIIGTIMGQMMTILIEISSGLSINLHKACLKKVELNARKYPVELCKGKAGKYTEYSRETGITKTIGQSTMDTSLDDESLILDWNDVFFTHSIQNIQQLTRQFAIDRDWLQYHTPRNIALALTGEIGELAEIFQFMGDDEDDDSATNRSLSAQQLDKVSQELADVTIYLCRLSDVCQIQIRNVNNES